MEELLLAVDPDLAFGRSGDSGEDGDQRRFAGAVLAEEDVHFAGLQREVDTIERSHAGIGFGNAGHFHQRWPRSHFRISPI